MPHLFENTEDARHKAHFYNLLSLAWVDEEFVQSERDFLYKLGKQQGMDKKELDRIVKHPKTLTFIVPMNPKERLEQIYDLVCMMLADKKVDEREVSLCCKIAKRLRFKPHIVGELVKALVTAVDDGVDRETVKEHLSEFLVQENIIY
ncbi:MAG: TerB family tellurite resistance protein [Cytophagales bacterium]|nr:TerB family tellurite resistance protein [Cytophagales bacterium]